MSYMCCDIINIDVLEALFQQGADANSRDEEG